MTKNKSKKKSKANNNKHKDGLSTKLPVLKDAPEKPDDRDDSGHSSPNETPANNKLNSSNSSTPNNSNATKNNTSKKNKNKPKLTLSNSLDKPNGASRGPFTSSPLDHGIGSSESFFVNDLNNSVQFFSSDGKNGSNETPVPFVRKRKTRTRMFSLCNDPSNSVSKSVQFDLTPKFSNSNTSLNSNASSCTSGKTRRQRRHSGSKKEEEAEQQKTGCHTKNLSPEMQLKNKSRRRSLSEGQKEGLQSVDNSLFNRIKNYMMEGIQEEKKLDSDDDSEIDEEYEKEVADFKNLNESDDESDENQSPSVTKSRNKNISVCSILSLDPSENVWDEDHYDEQQYYESNEDLIDYPEWTPSSKRWRGRFESLAETPVGNLRTLSDYLFSDKEVHLSISTSSPAHQSTVYLALQKTGGHEVCLKRCKMPKDIETRQQITDQAEILLQQLNHKNILKYYNFIQKKPNLFFISKLEMCNLRHWVSGLVNSAMTMRLEIRPINLVKGLIDGLAYLHKQIEITHGNLTPQNVLLNENGEAVIADPLLFKKFRNKIIQSPRKESENNEKSSTLSSAKKHIGECYKAQVWNAPEIILQEVPYNQEKHSKKSDIFSLGLLIFYIISYGEHAFAPKDLVHSSTIVKENILNNNFSFDVRQNLQAIYENKNNNTFDSDDSFNDSETFHFENLDIDERIFMERKYQLPEKLEIVLKSLLNNDENGRMKIELVKSKFDCVVDFSDFM